MTEGGDEGFCQVVWWRHWPLLSGHPPMGLPSPSPLAGLPTAHVEFKFGTPLPASGAIHICLAILRNLDLYGLIDLTDELCFALTAPLTIFFFQNRT
jgi:hypothetical protein